MARLRDSVSLHSITSRRSHRVAVNVLSSDFGVVGHRSDLRPVRRAAAEEQSESGREPGDAPATEGTGADSSAYGAKRRTAYPPAPARWSRMARRASGSTGVGRWPSNP